MTEFGNITDNTGAEVSGQADIADADGAISPDAVVAPDADAASANAGAPILFAENTAADSAADSADAESGAAGTSAAADAPAAPLPADADADSSDGMAKLAIIAGIASIVAIGVVVFLAMRGTICADALTGPVIKNTYVRFGRYIQDENEPEPIVWLVADVKDDEALLLSRKILGWKEFNDNNLPDEDEIVWANSTLREYLNNDFYNAAFNDEEKSRICVSHLKNMPCPVNFKGRKRSSGPDTDDRIFIPSYFELNVLKPPTTRNKKGRALYVDNSWRLDYSCATDKAIKEGALRAYFNRFFFSRKGYYPFWLRTSDINNFSVMTLDNWVSARHYTSKCGVRPALRMRVK